MRKEGITNPPTSTITKRAMSNDDQAMKPDLHAGRAPGIHSRCRQGDTQTVPPIHFQAGHGFIGPQPTAY